MRHQSAAVGSCVNRTLRRMFELERVSLEGKRPVATVHEQQRSRRADHQQILKSSVLEICEQGARREIKHANTRPFGNVLERSITTITIEPVGKTCGLTNIQII